MARDRPTWRTRFSSLRGERKEFDQSERRFRQRHLVAFRRSAAAAAGRLGARFPRLSRTVLVPIAVVARRIALDDVGTHAGALSYAALLSIPALLLFSLSIAGFVLAGNATAQQAVVDGLVRLLPESVASGARETVAAQMNAAIAGRTALGLAGLVGLLWSASSLASRGRHAFGIIFGTRRVGLMSGRLAGMVIGLIAVLAILGLAAASIVQQRVGVLGNVAANAAAVVGLLAGEIVFFLAIYRFLTPAKGPSIWGHLPGTIAFVITWEGLKALGGIYFAGVVTTSTALYGALGSLFGVIAFVYATVWLLLAGAELSAYLWTPAATQDDR